MNPRRDAAAAVLALLISPIAAILGVAWVFYALGNGLVPGTIALATLPTLAILLPILASGRSRSAWILLGTLLLGDLGFAAYRLVIVRTDGPFALCVDGICGGRSLLAGLIREEETTKAGIALTAALGMLSPTEHAAFVPAADEKYAKLAAMEAGHPGVNAPLLSSSPDRVTALVRMPSGEDKVPGILFLHGYGGLLTTYLSAFCESEGLASYAMIAPALGPVGAWWTPDGLAVVRRTLDTLPPRIDRDRLILVGLSNGAVGASAVAADPELSGRFKAAVLLVGADSRHGPPRIPTLIVAGVRDERFPIGYVEGVFRDFEEGNVPVRLARIEADHLALFTETQAVNEEIADWIKAYFSP